MSAIKIIDLKGLEHRQREQLLFPNLGELRNGDVLRIITEFNPLPLVYLLQAKNEYEIKYEKEGSPEWILKISKLEIKDEKKDYLKSLLNELKEGQVTDQTKEKAKEFLQDIDAKTLGVLEQEIIREGVSHEEVRKSLCDIHLEVMRDALVAKRIEVSAPHPIHTLMEEHQVILETLKELASLVRIFKEKGGLSGEELEKLKDVAHHLVEAESHHQREEEVLFPMLEKHDIVEPPEIMKMEHVEFRQRKQALYKISHNYEDYDPKEFKAKVIEYGDYISRELESHIFKENNILYQIALQVLTQEDWEEVKRGCDKIGYCCFTPGDQRVQVV